MTIETAAQILRLYGLSILVSDDMRVTTGGTTLRIEGNDFDEIVAAKDFFRIRPNMGLWFGQFVLGQALIDIKSSPDLADVVHSVCNLFEMNKALPDNSMGILDALLELHHYGLYAYIGVRHRIEVLSQNTQQRYNEDKADFIINIAKLLADDSYITIQIEESDFIVKAYHVNLPIQSFKFSSLKEAINKVKEHYPYR